MGEHQAQIQWQRSSPDFCYGSYNREHDWIFAGGTRVAASAAPAFLGNAEFVDPEEAFVASLAACHMLTFLALCAKKRIIVNSYTDNARGYLEKNADGVLAITRVELHPLCEFGGAAPDDQTLARLHESAHQECFIANSVRTNITAVY